NRKNFEQMPSYPLFRRQLLSLTHSRRHMAVTFYSGLNLNRYSVASPCRTICTVCGFVALS
ncbi:hypothetical protein, partial [Neisseria gonorrhoeae]|uniref:hypothetical protein n=1 Tax=Neisseria gonorrhoeae TaxID=485 RepID=UPI0035305615